MTVFIELMNEYKWIYFGLCGCISSWNITRENIILFKYLVELKGKEILEEMNLREIADDYNINKNLLSIL